MNDTPTSHDTDIDLGERLAAVNESLEALEIEVNLWDDEETTVFGTIVAELKGDNAALRAAAGRIGASAEAEFHSAAAKTRGAIDRLEGEVRAAWADFEAERADDVAKYRAATRKQLEAWQELLDRMRLQAHLAEMDAKDAVAEMEHAFDAARPELERAKDAAADALEALRLQVRELIAHLRQAARNASKTMA